MGANGSTKGKDHLAEAAAAGPAQPAQPAQEHDDGAHMVSVLRMAGVDVERILQKKTASCHAVVQQKALGGGVHRQWQLSSCGGEG